MVGNMLISGRKSGQVRLAIHGPGNFQAIPTKPGVPLIDIIADAEDKHAELKASPTPIETEIKFVETWLKHAYESLKEPAVPTEEAKMGTAPDPTKPSNVTPISPAASTTSTGSSTKPGDSTQAGSAPQSTSQDTASKA